jgi:signal transduction histidine kinase
VKLFQSALLKLSGWYLLLIMCISIGFSIFIYNVSSSEISSGFLSSTDDIFSQQLAPRFYNQFGNWRQQRAQQASTNLFNNLVSLNLFMLIAGGLSSFFLAKHTLRPIAETLESQMRFTSDASHELRTPLSVIKTELEVALRKKVSLEEAEDILRSNLEEIIRLENLVDRLLRLSTSQDLNFTEVDLEDIAIRATNRFISLAQKNNITIDNQAKPAVARADREALSDVVNICLDNAIKYSLEKSKITIATKDRSSKTDQKNVAIIISDTGKGIEKNDLEHLFERFYRADTSRSKQNIEGYGLGLSLAKKIIDLHHGDITISSKPGHGTTVKITLPRG